LLREILDHLRSPQNVSIVIVPRTKAQAAEIERELKRQDLLPNRILILRQAVSGRDLVDAADLLISGGGTMNREAVLLGVPVYSIFSGRLGSIDALMEHDGLMTFIRDAVDVQKIRLVKRGPNAPRPILTDRVERFIIDQINSFVKPS
jgi:predicted glycosyltransferase